MLIVPLITSMASQVVTLTVKQAYGTLDARYFSTEMGRFVSRDPLGYVDGTL